MNRPPFARSKTVEDPISGAELQFTAVNLLDKILINVQIDGAMDTTLDIPLSTGAAVRLAGNGSWDLDIGIEPVVLVGSRAVKINVVATQIAKLVHMTGKGVLLSIGSRWFGPDEVQETDFDKLQMVLLGVKSVL